MKANSGVLTTVGMMILQWQDSRLTWNMSTVDNLRYLQVKPSLVWMPSLILLNPASGNVKFPITSDRFWLQSNGMTRLSINAEFVTACAMDLSHFPYDSHTCDLEFTDINYWAYLMLFDAPYSTASLSNFCLFIKFRFNISVKTCKKFCGHFSCVNSLM